MAVEGRRGKRENLINGGPEKNRPVSRQADDKLLHTKENKYIEEANNVICGIKRIKC